MTTTTENKKEIETTQCDKFQPIEVTTHNLTFHENPNITSLDYKDNYIFTSGQDKSVRMWEVEVTDKNKFYKSNCYKTATNTSLKLKFICEFTQFSDPVNIVRIFKESEDFILAVGTEAGSIYYLRFKEEELEQMKEETTNKVFCKKLTKTDGNACIDLCCINETKIIVGCLSGEIKIIEIVGKEENNQSLLDTQRLCGLEEIPQESEEQKENTENIQDKQNSTFVKWTNKKDYKANVLYSKKVHDGIIQGISVCMESMMIVTKALDEQVKTFLLLDNILIPKDIYKKDIDKTHGANKRILVKDKCVYAFCKKNILKVYKDGKVVTEMGPFNAPLVKVLKDDMFMVVVTKKSIYIAHENQKVAYVDNVSYREITDAFLSNGIIFYCALDGFLGNIRLKMDKKQ